jgi:hypothetical protein
MLVYLSKGSNLPLLFTIAQVVSRRLPSAAARSGHAGYIVDKFALGQVSSEYYVVHVELSSLIPPSAADSLAILSLILYSAESFLRSRQSLTYPRISQQFMKLEGSLPCSQEPSTGPYLSQTLDSDSDVRSQRPLKTTHNSEEILNGHYSPGLLPSANIVW